MLNVENIKKYYTNQKAVDGISFALKPSTIFGLLGPNGAGKSSLLRMITGITMPDSGMITINGEPLSLEKHSRLIGYMPEERGLYKKMKIWDQALYLAQLKGLNKYEASQQINFWFDKLDMQSWRNKKVEDLSKGMSQKLQFVITVIHQPKLLILDEPFSGLDPLNSAIIKDEIYTLAQAGTTIIFSTHRMEQVEEICEEISLINKGKVILNGAVSHIKQKFKQNLYRLEVDQAIVGYEDHILSKNLFNYIFKFETASEANQLLSTCIQKQMKINTFTEILPSLNDIFIKLVEGDGASRNFDLSTHS